MTIPEPRADLRELSGYHSPQLDVQVRLNTNESPYPPPAEFVDAWCRALAAAPLHRYPDRAATELRAAIGARLEQPAARVFPANGSNEVLQTLLLAYGGPGRRALVFEPTYALHSHIARITGTEVVTAPRRDDFLIDPEHAAGVIAREQPDIVFVCSPNNPSGTVEPLDTVRSILAVAPGLVIVDEAYGEFAPSSAVSLVDDATPLVVTRTYSKVWSLAALRLGFALAPAAIVDELDKVVLPYHLDVATQTAGVIALDHVAAMEARVRHLIEERERLFVALDDLPGIEVFPSGANFLLFRASGRGHDLWDAMVTDGVLVRDFSRWPGVEDCLRVTIGTPEENDAFLTSLARALRESDRGEGNR
jgi:histidinol-phosphate aminotransferase